MDGCTFQSIAISVTIGSGLVALILLVMIALSERAITQSELRLDQLIREEREKVEIEKLLSGLEERR